MTSFEAYTHNGDDQVLREMGLKTQGMDSGPWLDLGTVEVDDATVRVQVASMPAQFWRLTIERESGLDGKLERTVLETGSGSFQDYWPVARMVAENTLTVKEASRCG
jgi:hypothetical protein